MMTYERAKAIGWAYVDSGHVWDPATLNQARRVLARHGSVGARQLLELMGDVRTSAWEAPVVQSVPAPARASSAEDMSMRAIAPTVGVSQMQVVRDSQVKPDVSPEPAERVDPATGEGRRA